jgi:hypothetical protein
MILTHMCKSHRTLCAYSPPRFKLWNVSVCLKTLKYCQSPYYGCVVSSSKFCNVSRSRRLLWTQQPSSPWISTANQTLLEPDRNQVWTNPATRKLPREILAVVWAWEDHKPMTFVPLQGWSLPLLRACGTKIQPVGFSLTVLLRSSKRRQDAKSAVLVKVRPSITTQHLW